MLKIAYFIDDLHLGGAEKLLLQIISHLDPKKFEVVLITQKQEGVLFQALRSPMRCHVTHNPWTLFNILRKEKPHVFHSHLWRSDLFGIPIAKLAGVPCVCSTKHNLRYFRGLTKIFIPLDMLCMHLCDRVFAISNAVKEYYQKRAGYRDVRFEVVHNGIDLKPFLEMSRAKSFGDSESLQMLTVANLIPQKGHLKFLELLSRMMDLPWEWHLVGDGLLRKTLEKKVSVLRLESRVHFHGRQADVLPFYKKADLFVLPSLWEGFGLVLLEAMASCVPIFASNVDGVKEILENEQTALLYDPRNLEESESKLRHIFGNPNLMDSFSEKSQKRVMEFSIEKTAARYFQFYLSALDEFP